MFKYKVEFSFPTGIGDSLARDHDFYFAANCQDAVDLARDEYIHLEDMRVDRVWKETITGSWLAVNAWR